MKSGRRIRTLNIIDHFTRQCKRVEVDFNLPARRVIEIVEQAIERYDKPLRIRTDNGPEFPIKTFSSMAAQQSHRMESHAERKTATECDHRTLQQNLS